MKYLFALLLLLSVLWIGSSAAGPNAGGVLVVHHDPDLIYTTGVCDSLVVPSDCSEFNPTAIADGSPQLWFILAAFPDSLTNRFSTVTFGLGDYDDTEVVIGAAGRCETFGTALEISSAGWPGPNAGTSVSWAPACGSGSIVPIYWFVTYAYASGTIPLGNYYPGQNATFVSCASPPEEDLISDYGVMGFGVEGQNPCFGGDGPEEGDGGGPPEEPLVVEPPRIDPRWGCWTFLTYGFLEAEAQSVSLVLDGEDLAPAFTERTTPHSRLWTFEIPDRDTTKVASLKLVGSPDLPTEIPLELARFPVDPERTFFQGRLHVRTERSRMGYVPGVRTRTLDELQDPDPQLLRKLRFLGVTRVGKTAYTEGEDPPIRYGPHGPYEASPLLWRSYRIFFREEHCERALEEMLDGTSGVEDAHISHRVFAYTPPCDGDISDTWYNYQWNLKNLSDTGEFGIGADHAWCLSRGWGGKIGVIDFPMDQSHPEISGQISGGDPPEGLCDETPSHATSMACIAAAAANAQGMVGVAPELSIVPIHLSCAPDMDEVALAFQRAEFWLGCGGDVVSVSVGIQTANPSPVLLDALQSLVLNAGIPVFAVRPYSNSYPGAWDQSHASENLVLSTGGSYRDGARAPNSSYADILAPVEGIYTCLSGGGVVVMTDDDTPSMSTPHVAAVAAMTLDAQGGCSPAELYAHLLETAIDAPGGMIVDAARAVGILTPVNPVVNFQATGGSYSVTLSWELQESEVEVWGFRLKEATSCWGPFEAVEGDPFIAVASPSTATTGYIIRSLPPPSITGTTRIILSCGRARASSRRWGIPPAERRWTPFLLRPTNRLCSLTERR